MTAVDYRGQTTLITGASAGLGAEFARQLAARGSDLVLVARRKERMEELAAELRARHRVQVHVAQMDLAADSPGQTLATRLERLGLHPTSVINNAGFATFGPFHQADPARLRREIAVDVTAVADISRAFVEQLRTAGCGVLVNVASMAAYQPNPRMALYGATKAFVLSLTEALWEESRGTGLRVLALSPGATRTEFFDVVGTMRAAGGTRLASPAAVVRTALAALDRGNPPPSVIAGRMNRVAAFAVRRLATRRQVIRAVGRLTAGGA
ncbi:SDR family NAD(P)-dependent oxidoreductase [Streptomyces marincola]|uniref:Oxidoreductase n=1 Tax=Streptomyces marincola TaxID=2878388 RepID=A0A1W7CS12_9ACTN|nr:SDR family oxidoreductase [Streptomyces marincola]ARQ67535.1 oxidoreductase [Streptomyces marincola]